jgi:hypothetical protein
MLDIYREMCLAMVKVNYVCFLLFGQRWSLLEHTSRLCSVVAGMILPDRAACCSYM